MPFDPTATRSGALFSTNPIFQGAWICYINGIEIPLIGFDLQYGVWRIPEFTIHVLPDISLQRLGCEDRVPVQIFYLDHWCTPGKPLFRLMCDGEIIGWSFSSSTGQRTMSFSCLSHIHVFQQLYFFYMTNVDDVIASSAPEVSSSGFAQAGLLYPYSLFHQGLLVTKEQRETVDAEGGQATDDQVTSPIKAPYEFVYNVIKGVISNQVPNERRSVPMMNFFARHIRKTNFHNRWVRLPILEDPDQLADEKGVFPIFNAARADEALNAMQRHVVSQVGSSGPVWNVFQQTLGTVYMEIAMIPNPNAVQVTLSPADGEPQDGKIIGYVNSNLTLQQSGKTTAPVVPTTANTPPTNEGVNPLQPLRLAQYFVKPQFLFGIPPACNIVFPSMIDSWTFDENYINQATRAYVNDAVMTKLLRAQHGPQRELMLHALTVGYPEEADAIMHHKTESASQDNENASTPAVKESGKNLLIWPAEYYQGPVTAKFELPSWFQMLRQFTNSRNGNETPDTPPTRRVLTNPNIDIQPAIPTATTQQAPASIARANVVANMAVAQSDGSTIQESGLNAGQSGTIPLRDRPVYAWRNNARRGGVLAINGTDRARYWILSDTGLDPRDYVEPQITYLWPPRFLTSDRRGQPRRLNPANYDTTKRATVLYQLMRPIVENVLSRLASERGSQVPHLNDNQLYAATCAVVYLSYQEGNWDLVRNWNFSNVRAFNTDQPRQLWSILPTQRLPYRIGNRPEEGARITIEEIFDYGRTIARQTKFTFSRSVLFGTADRNHEFYQIPEIARALNQNQAFWHRYGDIRPDLWDAALGYEGRNEEVERGMENNRFNRAIRNLHNITGQDGIIRRFILGIRNLLNSGPPPAVITVFPDPNAKPLASQADITYATNGGGHIPPQNTVPRRTSSRVRPRVGRDGRVPLPGVSPPATPTTNQAQTAAPAGSTNDAAEQPAELKFSNLFRIYAQYEFLKQKYSQRQASATLRFNPYLIPGFPMMLFDSMRTRMHIVGYIQSINHTGRTGPGGNVLNTSIGISCCRTFPEFLNDVRTDAERYDGRVTAAPAEIIRPIRAVIQDEAKAEEFYRRLLYGNAPRLNDVRAAFKWDDAMGYADGANTIPIEIIGDSVSDIEARDEEAEDAARTQTEENSEGSNTNFSQGNPATAEGSTTAGGVSSQGQQTVDHNIDPNRELSPKNNIYAQAFDSYDIAMQLASRPCCTLNEYIRFWHGGRTIGDLQSTGDVSGERTDFAYQKVEEKDVTATLNGPGGHITNQRGVIERPSAAYYDRIFKLRPGPGTGNEKLDPPSESERGYTEPPDIQPSATVTGLPKDYPQTRADWDLVLINYRDKVRTTLRPST